MTHSARTRELCLKLMRVHHLNVPERRELPAGRAPYSELVAVVQEQLAMHSWFPSRPPANRCFEHAMLVELRGTQVWIHEQHEIGVGRFSAIRASQANSLDEAVRAYIAVYGESDIDGVPIDWSA